MQALVKKAQGPGHLELMEVEVPDVAPDQVKIRVEATGICGTDIHMLHGGGMKMFPPVTLGHEFSGQIVEVGEDVKDWKVGDRVTAEPPALTCGTCEYCLAGYPALCNDRRSIGSGYNGAFADYLVIPTLRMHRLPDNVDYVSASLSEPAACCAHAVLESAGVKQGDTVLITGPGPMGLLSTQIAKAQGASVLIVGTGEDKERLQLGLSLGADSALVVGQDDVLQAVLDKTAGLGVNAAIECSGSGAAVGLCLEALKKHGTFVQVGLFSAPVNVDMTSVVKKELHLRGSFGSKNSSWESTLALMSSGQLQTMPLVTAKLPLSRWQEGFEMMEKKQACKVVLVPGQSGVNVC